MPRRETSPRQERFRFVKDCRSGGYEMKESASGTAPEGLVEGTQSAGSPSPSRASGTGP
jgi:hypothetical protein